MEPEGWARAKGGGRRVCEWCLESSWLYGRARARARFASRICALAPPLMVAAHAEPRRTRTHWAAPARTQSGGLVQDAHAHAHTSSHLCMQPTHCRNTHILSRAVPLCCPACLPLTDGPRGSAAQLDARTRAFLRAFLSAICTQNSLNFFRSGSTPPTGNEKTARKILEQFKQ